MIREQSPHQRRNNMKKDLSLLVLRIGLSIIFLYFGILALKDPSGQAAIWLNPKMAAIVTSVVSVKVFMMIMGVAQVAIALGCIFGVLGRVASGAAVLLLAGIIVNLGFNDIALRDLAILTGHLFLAINGGGKYVLVQS